MALPRISRLSWLMGLYGENEAAGFLMSLVGAVVLLGIYRMVARRRVTARV